MLDYQNLLKNIVQKQTTGYCVLWYALRGRWWCHVSLCKEPFFARIKRGSFIMPFFFNPVSFFMGGKSWSWQRLMSWSGSSFRFFLSFVQWLFQFFSAAFELFKNTLRRWNKKTRPPPLQSGTLIIANCFNFLFSPWGPLPPPRFGKWPTSVSWPCFLNPDASQRLALEKRGVFLFVVGQDGWEKRRRSLLQKSKARKLSPPPPSNLFFPITSSRREKGIDTHFL